MNSDLVGKRVLITGGTKGIGRATAVDLAQAGARVVVCHRNDDFSAARLVEELAGSGDQHAVIRADVTDESQLQTLADQVRRGLGGLDAVVNNAGVDGHMRLEDLDVEEWYRVLNVNVTAYYLVVRAVLPLLADPSSVVNIGASVALRGRQNGSHYTASKAAVHGLTRSMAKEFGPRGVRVNLVAPGVIDKGEDDLPPQVAKTIVSMTALGRLGDCSDVANAVAFLISDKSRYISGCTLHVDGGM
ncbi:MAG: SDR family oxidoreductase [Pseudonocardiales bacterium]|nr:SDR family oxidoreductase [Pseudonocardiales bacterium]MBV9729393.1 SDR family oxidoreductase [Pseudonocardiales bacterium]